MFILDALSISSKGNLEIGGCDTLDLVKEFGTPLYVMDEETIRKSCRFYKDAIDRYYPGKGLILYASKAFCSMAMCKIAEQEGLGIDVVSGGELYTAIKSGFPAEKIFFHGNNKTIEEIELAIENNIGRFIVDNREELQSINSIAKSKGKKIKILFRIKPGIEAHTHDFIRTGQIDSKFGVALENGEAFEIIKIASELDAVEVVGVHCHIGSQIFDIAPYELAAQVMLDFIAELKNKLGIVIKELNLGGGFGIRYLPEHEPIQYDTSIEAVTKFIKSECSKKNLELPLLIFEPGRSIVGPAGITLYTVGAVKDIKGVRKYVSVDGGMTDNPRYALYQSQYDALIANKPDAKKVEKVTIAGKCCESGDILVKDIYMPPISSGDILAILATGAYNYSMSSNYNRIPRPPVVLVNKGKARLIVKREGYEDIIRNDIIPEDL
ncbi:MAG TPA: diaminopimelate decarboxylase [Clostridiaceae bacterium]|nr:diaminopimelate decarboxylase [Clostridiaceae bacterium]